jgi:plasmid stabilization system protein ParE
MEMKVKWSRLALSDLRNIFKYIKGDSLIQANKIRSEIFDFSDEFAHRPRGATIVPEIKDETVRQRLFYGWRIIYLIEDKKNRIVIMAILHGKREFVHVEERF